MRYAQWSSVSNLSGDEGLAGVRSAYRDGWARLVAPKNTYKENIVSTAQDPSLRGPDEDSWL